MDRIRHFLARTPADIFHALELIAAIPSLLGLLVTFILCFPLEIAGKACGIEPWYIVDANIRFVRDDEDGGDGGNC